MLTFKSETFNKTIRYNGQVTSGSPMTLVSKQKVDSFGRQEMQYQEKFHCLFLIDCKQNRKNILKGS